MNNIDLIKNIKKYRPSEVCAMLGICYKTLYRYDKADIFKARRDLNNRRYYLKSDIEDFIQTYCM